MNILLIEPFYTGSHKNWAKGYIENSSHNIKLLNMPGRFWKWRMHGSAITLSKKYNELNFEPDLIIATDMLNLPLFKSLTDVDCPIIMYFHENQITYPFSSKDTDIQFNRDKHYSFINYSSALTADHIYFNSHFHMNSFFSGLTDYLNTLPDYQEIQNIQVIKQKSSVLHLGLDLKKFDNHKTNYECTTPIILWNHRWEYDKNPEDFFNIMNNLSQKKIHFNLVILGQQFRRELTCFKNARKNLKKHILEIGFSNSFTNYAKWLWKADILPITSNQDFFGTSIMEAVFCKTIPILPNRLTYPNLFNLDENPNLFYNDNKSLLNKLESMLENIEKIRMNNYRRIATKYDWSNMINIYDKEFSKYLL